MSVDGRSASPWCDQRARTRCDRAFPRTQQRPPKAGPVAACSNANPPWWGAHQKVSPWSFRGAPRLPEVADRACLLRPVLDPVLQRGCESPRHAPRRRHDSERRRLCRRRHQASSRAGPGARSSFLTAIGVISQTGGHIGDNWLASGVLWPEQPGQPSTVVDGCDSARRVVRQLVMSGARSGSVRGSRLRSSGFGRDGPSSDEGSRRPVHVRVRGSNPLRLHYTYSTLGLGRRAFGVTSRGATSQSGVLIGYSPGPRCVLAVVACARLVVGRELRTEEESSSRASSSGSGTDGRLRRGASVKVGDSLAGLPEAGITSKDDRLAAFGQVELRQDHGDVVGDRLGREEQCLPDLDVGEARGELVEDQPLTVGELRERRGGSGGPSPKNVRSRGASAVPNTACPAAAERTAASMSSPSAPLSR